MNKLIWLIVPFLVGCVSPQKPVFIVGVNSFARADSAPTGSYVLLPAERGRSVQDLEFIEFAACVERALANRGLQKAERFDTADLAVFIAYGIGEPKEHTYAYSLPLWGQTGVASSTTNGTVNVYGSTGSYSTTTVNTPQYGVTGYTKHEASYTTFTRHVFLTAYDLTDFRKTKSEKVVWETKLASTGSSGDLRQVFPVLVAAALPYIGVSTGKIVNVSILEEDSAVYVVKGISTPTKKK